MKKLLLLLSVCGVVLFTGCTQSLLTDEEYEQVRGPAPFSPDPVQHIPVAPDRPTGGY
ncbi:MAG: hypothetical protein LC627_01120 [Verrucomicrobiaceae bacterium]|nr:hypothetical protein [Verrucomicrobiaceae bacterium]